MDEDENDSDIKVDRNILLKAGDSSGGDLIFGGNKPQQKEVKKEVNLLDGLDNIFHSGGGTQSTTQPQGMDIFNLMGGQDMQGGVIDIMGSSQQKQGSDLFGNSDMFTNEGKNQETSPQVDFDLFGGQSESTKAPSGRCIFSNSDLEIHDILSKGTDGLLNAVYLVSNKTSSQITNIKLTFLAVKYIKVSVLGTTGSSLEPQSLQGVKKEISILNNEPEKKIVLKLKLSYSISSGEKNETITLDNFEV